MPVKYVQKRNEYEGRSPTTWFLYFVDYNDSEEVLRYCYEAFQEMGTLINFLRHLPLNDNLRNDHKKWAPFLENLLQDILETTHYTRERLRQVEGWDDILDPLPQELAQTYAGILQYLRQD